LVLSPDGLYLVSGHNNGMLAIWDRSTGDPIFAFQAHDRAVAYLSYPKPNELISADGPSSGKTWSISPKGLATPVSMKSGILDLPAPALPEVRLGTMTYTGGQDGIIRGWDSRQEPIAFVGERLGAPIISLGMDPEGYRFVATTSKADYLPYSGTKREQPIPGLSGKPVALRHPKDHPPLALLVQDRSAIVAEVLAAGLKELGRFDFSSSSVTCANLSTDGTQLAAGNDRGQVNLWSTTDKALLAEFDMGERTVVKNVAISSDGRFIACQGGDKVIAWRIGEANPRAVFSADGDCLLRFMPDGNRLISTTGGGALKVWDTLSGVMEFALYGHTGRVTALAISPNGQTLVSGGINGEVKFWDLRLGQESMEFQRHRGPVNAIEFSANGKFLVTAGNELAVWQVARE
jgi:WD40 repeat protein